MTTAASIVPGLIGFAVLVALFPLAVWVRRREWVAFARYVSRRKGAPPREIRALAIDPAAITNQRVKGWPDWHPEEYCHRCGQRNITPWYVDSVYWNRAAQAHEILCPQCFVEAYEESTETLPIWHLMPQLAAAPPSIEQTSKERGDK
jgi:hypothetical protein